MPILDEKKLKEIEEKAKNNNREIRFGAWFAKRSTEESEEEKAFNEKDAFNHINGKAVTFGEEYVRYDDPSLKIVETIDAHAFDEANMNDVVLNANHGDGNYAVARTRNGTLHLEIKADGVYAKADLRKDNPRTSQFYKDVSEGLLDKMSFAFTIKGQERSEEEDENGKLFVKYHVTKVDKVYDVSAVEFPAYENTAISATRAKDLVESFSNLVELERMKSKRENLIAKIEKAQKFKI